MTNNQKVFNMTGYLHPGTTLKLPAPYEVNSGDCIQIGAIFGVAKTWAAYGEQVEIITSGVFDVKKCPQQDWKIGEKLYWDAANREITNRVVADYFIGIAIDAPVGIASGLGRIKIFGLAQ